MPKFVVEWESRGKYVTYHTTTVDAETKDDATQAAVFGKFIDDKVNTDYYELDEVDVTSVRHAY